MALRKLERRNYGGKSPVNIKYQNLRSFKEGLVLLCNSILETKKNNTLIWLSSLYNPFKKHIFRILCDVLRLLVGLIVSGVLFQKVGPIHDKAC